MLINRNRKPLLGMIGFGWEGWPKSLDIDCKQRGWTSSLDQFPAKITLGSYEQLAPLGDDGKRARYPNPRLMERRRMRWPDVGELGDDEREKEVGRGK